MFDRIAVFGCGYVGLTLAALLAQWGHHVVGVDIDPRRIRCLSAGEVPIREPELAELVRQGLSQQRLRFMTDGAAAARECGVAVIAVGTPSLPDGSAYLGQVEAVVRTVAGVASKPVLLIVKSTVLPGTAARLRVLAPEHEIVIHPEFLRQGSAVADLRRPARRVFGAWSRAAAERAAGLYPPSDVPVVLTDPATAELSKYAANTFLATKISFINGIARLSEAVGADIAQVAGIMGLDPRIGSEFLQPGIGFGGSCLPKDTEALLALAGACGEPFLPGEAALAVNRGQPAWFVGRMKALLPPKPVVGVWGLAFKAGTDDLRSSPAISVIVALQEQGARVQAYDPAATAQPTGVQRCRTALEAAGGADALVVLTEWPEFRQADWQAVAKAMRGRHVFDGRNVTDGEAVLAAGLHWVPLGRPATRGEAAACMHL